jgi:predicted nucleic acid-binding protein
VARYALDASVVLARLLRENYVLVNEFWASLTPLDEIFGAQLLIPECTSVIRENVSKGRITPQEAEGAVADLIALPITTRFEREQFSSAIALAQRFQKFKAYDMQYLATAFLIQAELVTIDGGLRQTATEFGHPVRFLR